VHHKDVKSAFLNGDLIEEVYVAQPSSYVIEGQEQKVLKLHKALYGLKQTPWSWNEKLDKTLADLGFERCPYEYAMYMRSQLVVGVYVDDLVIGHRLAEITEFKEKMKKLFNMSDMGLLSFYLGIEVKKLSHGIFLNQSSYAAKIREKCGMTACNDVKTPMEACVHLSKFSTCDPVYATEYRSIIGSMRYLTHNLPDITFAVGVVSRYMENPVTDRMTVVRHILRYVKGTQDLGCFYGRTEQ
jgi:hypothetical protein